MGIKFEKYKIINQKSHNLKAPHKSAAVSRCPQGTGQLMYVMKDAESLTSVDHRTVN